MAIADMRAGIIDIPCQRGDDLNIKITTTFSLAGYSGWVAKAGDFDLTVDASEQNSDIISIQIPGEATPSTAKVKWSLYALHSGDKVTLLKGTLFPEEVPTSGD